MENSKIETLAIDIAYQNIVRFISIKDINDEDYDMLQEQFSSRRQFSDVTKKNTKRFRDYWGNKSKEVGINAKNQIVYVGNVYDGTGRNDRLRIVNYYKSLNFNVSDDKIVEAVKNDYPEIAKYYDIENMLEEKTWVMRDTDCEGKNTGSINRIVKSKVMPHETYCNTYEASEQDLEEIKTNAIAQIEEAKRILEMLS